MTVAQRRKAARATGERTFNTGVPCIHGHECPRWTCSGICVECSRVSYNTYNAAHRALARSKSRAWYLANKDHANASSRAWTRNNPKKKRDLAARWKKENPHKLTEYAIRRRARLLGAPLGDRKAHAAYLKWARQAKRVPCYWCGENTNPKERHIDHIIPLVRGGADAVANLCVSCVTCNLTKHTKMPEVFAGQSELRLA